MMNISNMDTVIGLDLNYFTAAFIFSPELEIRLGRFSDLKKLWRLLQCTRVAGTQIFDDRTYVPEDVTVCINCARSLNFY